MIVLTRPRFVMSFCHRTFIQHWALSVVGSLVTQGGNVTSCMMNLSRGCTPLCRECKC